MVALTTQVYERLSLTFSWTGRYDAKPQLATTPPNGQVLIWNNGQYIPGPPITVAPGLIFAGPGIDGDGSSGNPLVLDVCSYDELKAACTTP